MRMMGYAFGIKRKDKTMKKSQTSILTSIQSVISAVDQAISRAQTGNKNAASPLKTDRTEAKQSAGVISPAKVSTSQTGQNTKNVYSTSKAVNDAVRPNEKQMHEAQLVRQLPSGFPIENWEKMPTKAQLFAVQHSGLSKEDQWTLLNATTPLKVLATASPIITSGASNTAGSVRQPAPLKTTATASQIVTSGASYAGSSGGQQPPFSGQDAETQRAEQRASRQATNAYNQLNQALTDHAIQTSSLSGTGNDIYKNARITIANYVLQGTLDSGKQSKIIQDASAGIAPGKTAPTSVQEWKQRVSQADIASKEMFNMLESVRVDTNHLTTEQSYIVEKAERQLRDGIINGALDENGVDEMIRRICNKVTSETMPPPGVAYVTIMDTGFKKQPVRQMIPALGTLESSGFNTDALEAVREDSDDPYQRTVYNQAIADYNLAIKNGNVEVGDFDSFYNAAMKKAYENSARKFDFVYTNEKGKKVTGTVAMKDLIDPEDDSIGARLVRYALDLYGLGYGKSAVHNPNKPLIDQIKGTIDCSGLVKYAAYQINPYLGLKGVGNNAYYQMIRMEDGVVWQKNKDETQPNIEELKTGDLLYWADENGIIVHTAIYAGNGLMVESAGTVHIEEVRFTTYDRDGSKSTLVQVNRLEDSKVAKYATNGTNQD